MKVASVHFEAAIACEFQEFSAATADFEERATREETLNIADHAAKNGHFLRDRLIVGAEVHCMVAVKADQFFGGRPRVRVQETASRALCNAVGPATAVIHAANNLKKFAMIWAAADAAGYADQLHEPFENIMRLVGGESEAQLARGDDKALRAN